MSSLNKNDTSSLNDFDTLDMCIIYMVYTNYAHPAKQNLYTSPFLPRLVSVWETV